MNKYTDEQKAWLEEFIPGHSYKEISEAFNKHFDTDIMTPGKANAFCGNNKISTGHTGRFQKGHAPQNKGKKMSPELYEKAKPTMFKKGHTPVNHKPIGSERINGKDGYIMIKVAEPNVWRLKQRVIWEEIHGPIPKDCVIRFLDGDKTNLDSDNLVCVNRNINKIINQNGLGTSGDIELGKTGIALAKLYEATYQVRKKQKDKE